MISNWPSQYPSSASPTPQHDGTQDVEEREHRVAHPGGAGDQRRERPHDRHEPGDHDGERAALLEEGVGLVEILLLEQLRVRLEHRGADVAADPVADLSAEYGGDRDEDQQLPELEVDGLPALLRDRGRARGEHACDEQQRIPGQDREQQPDSTKMTTSIPTSAQVPK